MIEEKQMSAEEGKIIPENHAAEEAEKTPPEIPESNEPSEEEILYTTPGREQVNQAIMAMGDENLNLVSRGDEEATAAPEEDEKTDKSEKEIDYTTYSREQLAQVVHELSKQDNFKHSDAVLSKVLPLFKDMARARRKEALEKFMAEGGEEDDFEFRHDEVFNRFDASVRLIRDRRAKFFKELEAKKEENYKQKLEILQKLRELIDGENTTTRLSPVKALQEAWKGIGRVPAQHNRTLWANYNALLDRFYNNRHILFELKELGRKKNLAKKTELCEKAEALSYLENIKDATIRLDELHDEYKKTGAVPREVQESLWQRFKAASDAIYKKRKSHLEDLKGELMQNLEKKRELAEALKPYLAFHSDRIKDWNAKTKKVMEIQKRWDALGGLPREYAKEVNKAFWSGFKGFLNRKNAFFKKLEGIRRKNLEKKQELVAKAKVLSEESKDVDKTSEALKALQQEWKEIGPVPDKFSNSVYAEFKEVCDAFFNRRRASQGKAEAVFVENRKHKEALIKEVQERAAKGGGEVGELDDFLVRWNAIGFVPKSTLKTVEDKFSKALGAFVKSLDMADEEREALLMKAELSSLKKGPNSDRKLNKKESDLRRKVKELEDNLALWHNNLTFFANSKGADKLREEYNGKIADAEKELAQLKKQLSVVRSM